MRVAGEIDGLHLACSGERTGHQEQKFNSGEFEQAAGRFPKAIKTLYKETVLQARAMSSFPSHSPIDPFSLPHVWRVQDLAATKAGMPTGSPLLDRMLPGGGWPQGSMIEVLQERPGQHVWQLLMPALVSAVEQSAGPMVLVGAPYQPFGPSLKAQGLAAERLLCVHSDKPALRLWATEQALRCGEVAAVLSWLPEARANDLRRLHMAAQQQSRLLFVFRGSKARHEASPAPLRVMVEGVDRLDLHILKRRGPPLSAPLELPAHSPQLAALLKARKAGSAAGSALPSEAAQRRSHVLDRTASLA
jgi:protein ImuA